MIKTIAYKRVLNIGNYESKHLEVTYELGEGEEPGFQISTVMEMVERKIREDQAIPIVEEIAALRHELRQLETEHRELLEGMTEILVLIRKVSFND
jgi:predicted Zn-dependent peptidase